MEWFRLYHDARTDRKLASLTDRQFRCWFHLLVYSSEQTAHRGTIRGVSDEVLAIEVADNDVALLAETVARLRALAMLGLEEDGALTFLGWQRRQYETRPPSQRPEALAQRQAESRATRRASAEPAADEATTTPAPVTTRSRLVTTCHDPCHDPVTTCHDTDTDTESDTESESSPSKSPPPGETCAPTPMAQLVLPAQPAGTTGGAVVVPAVVQPLVDVLAGLPNFRPTTDWCATVAEKYGHLDLREEAQIMRDWLEQSRGRRCSARFVTNWLKRAAADAAPLSPPSPQINGAVIVPFRQQPARRKGTSFSEVGDAFLAYAERLDAERSNGRAPSA